MFNGYLGWIGEWIDGRAHVVNKHSYLCVETTVSDLLLPLDPMFCTPSVPK